ncbi:MAG: rod shape-determining protein MreD [candidate division KSB1 bacterium]|nr:rod shape-determining protein MreD [candidate division KSB1 bacterium]
MRRLGFFLLACAAAVALQSTVVGLLEIAGTRPNLPLLLLLAFSLRLSILESIGLAFLVGLMADLAMGAPVGLSSLGFTLAAFLVRVPTQEWVHVSYQRMAAIWAVGAAVYEGLVYSILCLGSELGLMGALLRFTLPAIAYDVAFGVLILAALPQAWWRRL